MKSKRLIAFVLGSVCVVGAFFLVIFGNLESFFWITILMGFIGILLISWGSMYFIRNFPDTAVGIENDRDKCVELSRKLFEGAKESIRIVGGELHNEFYDNDKITESLKKALSDKVKVEIICGPKIDEKDAKLMDLEKQRDGLTIDHLSYYPKRHFTIVDKKGVRLEKEHPIPLSKNDRIVATTYYHRPFLAFQLNKTFESLKSKVSSTAEKE